MNPAWIAYNRVLPYENAAFLCLGDFFIAAPETLW